MSGAGDAFRIASATQVRMDQNESPYGMSPEARDAAVRALTRAAWYPDSGSPDLCGALAEHHRVDPAMVMVGAGSIELILTACHAWGANQRPVVVTQPGFPGYAMMARIAGVPVREVVCEEYRVDVAAVAAALAGAGCGFVCDPLNPTGSALEPGERGALIEAAAEAGSSLVLDEAYVEFAGPEHRSGVDDVRAGADAVVLRTFSKAYGLAGLRVGYAIAPARRIAELRRWRAPFTVSRVAQAAAGAALDDGAFLARAVERVAAGRAMLEEGMARLGLEVVPGRVNFAMAAVPGGAAALAGALGERSFLVQELTDFGLPDHLRVTVGTEEQNVALLEAMAEVLAVDSTRRRA